MTEPRVAERRTAAEPSDSLASSELALSGATRQAVPRLSELLPTAQAALGRFAVGGVVPILTFYVLFRLFGPTAGIAGGMATSLVALTIQAHRLKRLDPVVLVPMALILVQGSLAIALDSVEMYLLVPAVENVFWAIGLIGSALLRRPLVRLIARELRLIPPRYAGSPAVDRALAQITLAWGLLALVKSAARLWLLQALPLEAFLVAVTVFNSAANGGTLAFSFWWTLRAARSESAAARVT